MNNGFAIAAVALLLGFLLGAALIVFLAQQTIDHIIHCRECAQFWMEDLRLHRVAHWSCPLNVPDKVRAQRGPHWKPHCRRDENSAPTEEPNAHG